MEFLVAIGLMAMILSLGYVVSFDYLRTQNLKEAAETVHAGLTRARADAFAQTNDANHGIKVFPDRMVRFEGISYAARVQAKDLATPFPLSLTLSGDSEVVWIRGGLRPAAPATVTLQNGAVAVDITISAYGLVTLAQRTIGN